MNFIISGIYVNIYLKGILYPFLRKMTNGGTKMNKEKQVIRLEKRVNVLCCKILANFKKGQVNETREKDYWELVAL